MSGPAGRTAWCAGAVDATGPSRTLCNIVQLLGGKAGAGLLSLGYVVAVAHRLGARDYGVLMLLNAYAVTCGSVLAFSGFHGVVRYGALAREGGDPARLARLVRASAVIELGCGVAAVAIAAGAARLVGARMGWPPAVLRIAPLYSLALLSTVRATPQGVLQLAGRFDLIGLHQLVSPVVRASGVALVWAAGGGLMGFAAVWLASSLAEGVAMWLFALPPWTRLTEGARIRGDWRGVAREHRGFVRFILATNFDITLRELGPNLVPLVVGWMLGPIASGLWSLAQRITAILKQPAQLLAQASYAVLAEHAVADRFDLVRRSVWRGIGWAAVAGGFVLAAVGIAGDRIVTLLGGRSFGAAAGLVLLSTLAHALTVAATPLVTGLTALGHAGRAATVAFVTNLVIFPLLPALVHVVGLDGAGIYVAVQGATAALMLAPMFASTVYKSC